MPRNQRKAVRSGGAIKADACTNSSHSPCRSLATSLFSLGASWEEQAGGVHSKKKGHYIPEYTKN